MKVEKRKLYNPKAPNGYEVVDCISVSDDEIELYRNRTILRMICKQFAHESKKRSPVPRRESNLKDFAVLPRVIKNAAGLELENIKDCIDTFVKFGLCNPDTFVVSNTGNINMVQKTHDILFRDIFPISLEKACIAERNRLNI